MRKNILIYIFLLGCFFSAAAIFLCVPKQQENSADGLSLKDIFRQEFNRNSDGVLYLDISSPIFYQSSDGVFGGEAGVENWIQQVEDAINKPNIKGLLMRINSPGGGVVASEEFYKALVRFRKSGKKIVVSIKSLCASGGYYISVPAHKIIANQGSIIGSIGVIISSMEIDGLYEKIGVRNNVIKSGKYKDIFSPARKMTKDEKENIQSLVDSSYQQFLSVIYTWRGDKNNKKKRIIKQSANGMIYSAEESIKRHLIDEIGDLEKAKKVIAKMCNLDDKNLNLIYPKKTIRIGNSVIEVLLNFFKIPFISNIKNNIGNSKLQYMYID